MKRGGTAVDAAIATLFCNGVVHPQSMGIGGGFFMVIYQKDKKKSSFINARGAAPTKAKKDMYVDSKLSPIKGN